MRFNKSPWFFIYYYPHNADIETAKSSYKNGILEITFNKKEQTKPKGKEVRVKIFLKIFKMTLQTNILNLAIVKALYSLLNKISKNGICILAMKVDDRLMYHLARFSLIIKCS